MGRFLDSRSLVVFILILGVSLAAAGSNPAAAKAKKEAPEEYAFTEAELQLELMNYGDRFAAVIAQGLEDSERLGPPPETRRAILGDAVYSATAVFTIAADAEPQVALLDMVVLATLGRMVYEDYWRPRLGDFSEPMLRAFNMLEGDIWTLAGPILDETQRAELRERIEAFHRENPELSTFSHLRFADFPSRRASSTLKKKKSGGIFGSVKRITEQVEQTRVLAERGLYLSTRLPLLTGAFADVWVSRLSANPAVSEMQESVRTFAEVSERLARVAEELPERITNERRETIEQVAREAAILREESIEHLLEGLTEQRRDTLEQLAAEEERLGGLLAEIRGMLDDANTLTLSVDGLAQRLDLGAEKPGPPKEPAEPLDIEEVRATIVDSRAVVQELNGLVLSTTELLNSPGADRLVPGLVEAIEKAGATSEDLVDHSMIRAALLILFALGGYVVARLCYGWLAMRWLGKTP
jgi:hypothetical protein